MKLIIAGGRDYQFTQSDFDLLDGLRSKRPIEEVVSGGASAADKGGEDWAQSRDIPLKRFPARWDLHGLAAGPIRNRQMAEYADAVALFPGGRGTESMYQEAKRLGLKIYDFRRQPEIGGFWIDDNPAPTGHKSLHDYQQQLKAKRKRK